MKDNGNIRVDAHCTGGNFNYYKWIIRYGHYFIAITDMDYIDGEINEKDINDT